MNELTPKQKREQVNIQIIKLKDKLNDLHCCLDQCVELLGSFFSMAFDLDFEISIAKVKFEKEHSDGLPSKKTPRKPRAKKSDASVPKNEIVIETD